MASSFIHTSVGVAETDAPRIYFVIIYVKHVHPRSSTLGSPGLPSPRVRGPEQSCPWTALPGVWAAVCSLCPAPKRIRLMSPFLPTCPGPPSPRHVGPSSDSEALAVPGAESDCRQSLLAEQHRSSPFLSPTLVFLPCKMAKTSGWHLENSKSIARAVPGCIWLITGSEWFPPEITAKYHIIYKSYFRYGMKIRTVKIKHPEEIFHMCWKDKVPDCLTSKL